MTKSVLNRIISDFSAKVAVALKDAYGDGLVSVCLFGSAARETLRKGSDIDFLVLIKETALTYHKRIKELMPLLDIIRETNEYLQMERLNLGLEPCFLVFTVEEIKKHPPILIEISQEGMILFDSEYFLNKQLIEVRESLEKLGAVKKTTPHGHYWILKPGLKFGEVIRV